MPSKRKKTKKQNENQNAPVDNVNEIISTNYGSALTARKYLILGVVFFLIVIGFLWAWALKIKIGNASFKRSSDGVLIESTSKNWEKIFAETKNAEDAKLKIRQQVKNLLNQISAASTSTASSPTSTATTTN